ncbi:MAG: hypothetical protein E6230_12700 [Paenibacillus dendritiformis]|uniref:hypothetical protein n=1 Tax=Paenibacillus dendritiformis TaxID=130049 RepID=UPI00143DC60D|nr:hypothetical protein [Paenibacillus dendritiformis]MDU5143036.1 hypothetical protein [Paenibacillus dendritiformis]NKI24839.1 hypothetical protein [Paenibacillus dendritiformis]NRF97134.1 hypothetical protein [Paenibacillus dendritiformis]
MKKAAKVYGIFAAMIVLIPILVFAYEQGDIIQVGMSDPEGVDWKNYKHKHEEKSP